MLDVLYVGLTVAFFVAIAALAKGIGRLTGLDSPPAAEPVAPVATAEPRP